ncbi:MAG: nucleotidyltransferase domain-containing protein [Gemmatimonadaceae bacterium]|nr:nucleotidyltransferase domain-containing protein [Gemmatimonadaceae bacterium]
MAKMTLDELVSQLAKAFGDGLEAVVLYGSAAAGEHIPKRSDYNVLVLVRELGMPELEREAAIARAWGEAGNPPPLTMTTAEWRSSSDVFPMEYADVLERHRVLHGTPPFDGITVDPRDLRVQLEHEAMGKLLQLRQGILSAGGEEKKMLELLAASLSTFMVIFRSVLRYHGEMPSTDYEKLVAALSARTGIDGAPFVRVVRHLRGSEPLPEREVKQVLAGYLAGAHALVVYLDRLGSP